MIILLNKKLLKTSTIYVGLLEFYGISTKECQTILRQVGVSKETTLEKLYKSPRKWEKLNSCLSRLFLASGGESIEKNLRIHRASQIHRLKSINCNRGQRLSRGYPSRGQRTRSNGKTAKKLS